MRRLARAVALLAVLLLALPTSSGAAPASQGGTALGEALLWANMCGAGDPRDVHFTIAATGDTFPHENIQAAGEANGYDSLFDYVRPFLKAADVAYTNFDGAMLEGSPYTGYPAFNFNPRLADALRGAGIGLVSTANNHILDRGPAGLDATLGVLARAGIAQHGAVTMAEAQSGAPRPPYLPLVLTRDGVSITVGFISATWGTNGIPDPHGQVNLLWHSNSYGSQGGVRQSVLDAVAQASRETDLVVVAAHWGAEYQFYPQPYQVEGAQRLAEAGADIILGAQSHTLQPVDVIDTAGRKTLVIYSLANFLASQGAFQNPYYSATSVVFYAGVVREPGGDVRVTGYRYLPTIHVDADTRPAPIPPAGYEGVIDHVRLIMRDFDGARQVPHDPAQFGGRVEVCPSIGFSEVPGVRLGGDFAQHYITLGSGVTPREPRETLAVLGLPLGPPASGPAGDCAGETTVLYTDRQRLELDPGAAWPYRVVGTRLGVEALLRRHGAPPQPLADALGNPLPDERFRVFYQRYGGLPVFGYPISIALDEPGAGGDATTVQYFERARLELLLGADPAADPLGAVRVAPLGRQALEEGWVCAAAAEGSPAAGGQPEVEGVSEEITSAPPAGEPALPPAPQVAPPTDSAVPPALSAPTSQAGGPVGLTLPPVVSAGPWLWPLLTVAALVLAGALAAHSYRGRRGRGARPVAWSSWRDEPPETDEELLRRLMAE
jgi:hypothetical protein